MARFGFDCDSVWLRRDFVAVGETCYACYLAGVDFMLPFAPLFFCAISSMLGHEAYVFRTPVGLFFVGRRGRGQKAALTRLSPSAPAGLDTVGWKAFATLSESTELGRRSRTASPSISPVDKAQLSIQRTLAGRRGPQRSPELLGRSFRPQSAPPPTTSARNARCPEPHSRNGG